MTIFQVHQFGLFQFRTGRDSRPSTPTAKSRVAIFGLDAISRNLFSSRPGSAMGDFFGGSINGHRRTKSTTSRSSIHTQTSQTTLTADGSLMKFSHRSNSTAATTMSMDDDDDDLLASKSSKARQPTNGHSDSEKDILNRSISRYSSSREMTPDYSDDEAMIVNKMRGLDTSDWDLAMKLELARQNSMNQRNELPTSSTVEFPLQDTIYEGQQFFLGCVTLKLILICRGAPGIIKTRFTIIKAFAYT